MKKIFLSTLIVISLLACSKTINKDQLQIRQDGKAYEVNSNTPFSGEVKLDEYGAKESYENGLKDGQSIYNASNHKSAVKNYSNGKLNGESIYYHESNGSKKLHLNYHNNTLTGNLAGWWDNGQKKYEVEIDSNSIMTPVEITMSNGDKSESPQYVFGSFEKLVSEMLTARSLNVQQVKEKFGKPSEFNNDIVYNGLVFNEQLVYQNLSELIDVTNSLFSLKFSYITGNLDISVELESRDENFIKRRLGELTNIFTNEEINTKEEILYGPNDYMEFQGKRYRTGEGTKVLTSIIKKPWGVIVWSTDRSSKIIFSLIP